MPEEVEEPVVAPAAAQTFQQFVEQHSWIPSDTEAADLAAQLAGIDVQYRCTFEQFKRTQRALRSTEFAKLLKDFEGKVPPFKIIACLRAVGILDDQQARVLFAQLLGLVCPCLECKSSDEPRVPKSEAYKMFHTAAEAAVTNMPAPYTVAADASAEDYYKAQLTQAFTIDMYMHMTTLSMQFKQFGRQILALKNELAEVRGKKRVADADGGDNKKGTFVCPDWVAGKCKNVSGPCSKGKHSASLSTAKFLNKLLGLNVPEEELKKRTSE